MWRSFKNGRIPPGIPAESSAALFAPMANSDVYTVETVVPKEEALDKADTPVEEGAVT
jgi:hypothetical protein